MRKHNAFDIKNDTPIPIISVLTILFMFVMLISPMILR